MPCISQVSDQPQWLPQLGGRQGRPREARRVSPSPPTHFLWISSSSCTLRHSKLTPSKLSPLPSPMETGQRVPTLFPSAHCRAQDHKGHPEAGKQKALPRAAPMADCLTVAGPHCPTTPRGDVIGRAGVAKQLEGGGAGQRPASWGLVAGHLVNSPMVQQSPNRWQGLVTKGPIWRPEGRARVTHLSCMRELRTSCSFTCVSLTPVLHQGNA